MFILILEKNKSIHHLHGNEDLFTFDYELNDKVAIVQRAVKAYRIPLYRQLCEQAEEIFLW